MPLRPCQRNVQESVDGDQEGGFVAVKSLNNVEDGGAGDCVKSGGFQGVKASNKGVTVLKDGGDGHSMKLGGFQGVKASNNGDTVLKEDTVSAAVLGSFKISSYNVWF